tara:strand:+ start:5374 stop:6054 length:681 start_codon:yes stop_codon:yes gene_type:complete
MKGMADYIKESSEKAQKKQKEFKLFGDISVFIKDPLPEDIDIRSVLAKLESLIPRYFASGLDMIIIGANSEFEERDINAMYRDGAIYVTNFQITEGDLLDDIIHELAHAVEENNGEFLYSDELIFKEFMGKRKRLLDILTQEGYSVDMENSMNAEYNREFDEFLYQEVGYPTLTSLTMGLFASPYGATSLREYFANGFEEYFLGDRNYLKKISPFLYSKLDKAEDL